MSFDLGSAKIAFTFPPLVVTEANPDTYELALPSGNTSISFVLSGCSEEGQTVVWELQRVKFLSTNGPRPITSAESLEGTAGAPATAGGDPAATWQWSLIG